jgi:ornithine cyclodeaminase/alanine dehydrogenase-like protein (mu-crystallin family)
MKLLVLSGPDLHGLLPPGECAQAMRDALGARASGRVSQPLRTVVRPGAAAGMMALMPAVLAPGPGPGGTAAAGGGPPRWEAAYGLKAICIFPGNPARGLDTHQGVVLLSSAHTGEPLALLNASAVTEIRTAAVSAVATQALARAGAAELAIIGTGVQARAHLRAISATRKLTGIRVAGRDRAKARRFADEMGAHTAVPVSACGSVAEAVDGAGIVVTATTAEQPVLRLDWLAPGTHINAVGACFPRHRELDTATMAAAALFADSRESVLAESGDYLLALGEGAIGPGHLRAELGEVLTGGAPGRTSDGEITVFESLGLAVEDLATAVLAYQKAAEAGVGSWVDF